MIVPLILTGIPPGAGDGADSITIPPLRHGDLYEIHELDPETGAVTSVSIASRLHGPTALFDPFGQWRQVMHLVREPAEVVGASSQSWDGRIYDVDTAEIMAKFSSSQMEDGPYSTQFQDPFTVLALSGRTVRPGDSFDVPHPAQNGLPGGPFAVTAIGWDVIEGEPAFRIDSENRVMWFRETSPLPVYSIFKGIVHSRFVIVEEGHGPPLRPDGYVAPVGRSTDLEAPRAPLTRFGPDEAFLIDFSFQTARDLALDHPTFRAWDALNRGALYHAEGGITSGVGQWTLQFRTGRATGGALDVEVVGTNITGPVAVAAVTYSPFAPRMSMLVPERDVACGAQAARHLENLGAPMDGDRSFAYWLPHGDIVKCTASAGTYSVVIDGVTGVRRTWST